MTKNADFSLLLSLKSSDVNYDKIWYFMIEKFRYKF